MARDNRIFHFLRIACAPRTWANVAAKIGEESFERRSGHALYGVWRSQIGRPRDELTVITVGPTTSASAQSVTTIVDAIPDVIDIESRAMAPTLRPVNSTAPHRQGNYAFRHFTTPAQHFDEFLELCAGAWPGFEASYDSQVVGLWRFDDTDGDMIDTLLLTRRPSLAMWERSKIPQGDEETEVRRKLSRRYDLCESTVVYTTTLLTAKDQSDTVRWT